MPFYYLGKRDQEAICTLLFDLHLTLMLVTKPYQGCEHELQEGDWTAGECSSHPLVEKDTYREADQKTCLGASPNAACPLSHLPHWSDVQDNLTHLI